MSSCFSTIYYMFTPLSNITWPHLCRSVSISGFFCTVPLNHLPVFHLTAQSWILITEACFEAGIDWVPLHLWFGADCTCYATTELSPAFCYLNNKKRPVFLVLLFFYIQFRIISVFIYIMSCRVWIVKYVKHLYYSVQKGRGEKSMKNIIV